MIARTQPDPSRQRLVMHGLEKFRPTTHCSQADMINSLLSIFSAFSLNLSYGQKLSSRNNNAYNTLLTVVTDI